MPKEPAEPTTGRSGWAVERVAVQVASTYEHLQRSHRQVQSGMAQVRRVDGLQEAGGWPERTAAARAHAAHARELSRRAREELARIKARAAASRSWVGQAQQHLT